MNKFSNKKLTSNSQSLRTNMTKEERHLWYDFLKNLPVTIHRQKVIDKYIVDFYCAEKKVIIELDGSQHYDSKGMLSDIQRDKRLTELGFLVLRYSNHDIKINFRGVCTDIMLKLDLLE